MASLSPMRIAELWARSRDGLASQQRCGRVRRTQRAARAVDIDIKVMYQQPMLYPGKRSSQFVRATLACAPI